MNSSVVFDFFHYSVMSFDLFGFCGRFAESNRNDLVFVAVRHSKAIAIRLARIPTSATKVFCHGSLVVYLSLINIETHFIMLIK